MTERRHEDNSTRVAHEIEVRLHHGENSHSVVHDELHKLQKLDSLHGKVDSNKFKHDVDKVEHKLHKDGYLPHLHLTVDHKNHVHLETKKHPSTEHPYGQLSHNTHPTEHPRSQPNNTTRGQVEAHRNDSDKPEQHLPRSQRHEVPGDDTRTPYRDPRLDRNRMPDQNQSNDQLTLPNPNMRRIPDQEPNRSPDFTPPIYPNPLPGPYRDQTPHRDQPTFRGQPTLLDQPTFHNQPTFRDQPTFQSGRDRFENQFRGSDRDFAPPIKTEGDFREMRLDNRVSNHAGADALVYVRKDFDPSKPIHLAVYNHGFGSTVSSALDKNQIKEMMSHAQANTVLVLPEWQASPGSRSGNSGTFAQQNRFTNMVQEMMQKTPALQGASLANVDRIDIIAHSAGYSPTENEIYKNPALSSKVHSITLLDSLYDKHGFDKWLGDNISDLTAGRKQFYNFANSTTAGNSRAQGQFIESLIRSRGLPANNYIADYGNTNGEVARHASDMTRRSIVFASTSVRHLDIPGRYIGATLTAINPERFRQPNS